MALQNRVDPWGVVTATPARGTWMGNRGILHDDDRNLVRPRAQRAWIICQLAFKERRRELMSPGKYTELFFLDEATALAAGHRPCFECRRDDATRFLNAWRRRGGREQATVRDVDRELSEQRRLPRSGILDGKRAYRAVLANLPDGVMVDLDGRAHLVHEGDLVPWNFEGYRTAERRTVRAGAVSWVLTPYGTVRALQEGYTLAPHPTLIE